MATTLWPRPASATMLVPVLVDEQFIVPLYAHSAAGAYIVVIESVMVLFYGSIVLAAA
nr:hypothetical protein [Mycobacterium leprae]